MQKIISCVCVVSLILVVIFVGGFTNQNQDTSNDLFRIHIVANSNSSEDSNLKYKIKDAFTSFLSFGLASCESKSEVQNLINDNISNLTAIANSILKENNFNYTATIKITNEYFPARIYDDITAPSGYYDGITVTLGQGLGDNWWCVLFPPLCFYNASETNSNLVVYKSKLLEIIKKFTKQN